MPDLRDRTNEFFHYCQTVQSSHPAPFPSSSSSTSLSSSTSSTALGSPLIDQNGNVARPPADPIGHKSKFTRYAQDIARRIHSTADKMGQLTQLAKRRSNFDDPTQQIDVLTSQVNGELKTLNQELEALARFGQTNPDGHPLSQQGKTNNEKIVQTLQFELGQATKDFTGILHTRTENLKKSSERREAFGGSSRRRKRVGPVVNFQDESLLLPDQGASDEGGDAVIEIDTAAQLELQEQDRSDEYLQSRGQAVENIEKTIKELSQMYQRLVEIVSMQGEMAERIDQNVAEASHNVMRGEEELWKLHNSFSNSQWLILKVFLFLILFSVFFIVFVA